MKKGNVQGGCLMGWTVGRKLSAIFIVMMGLILAMSLGGVISAFTLNENTNTINQKIIPKIESINALKLGTQNVLDLTQRHILSNDESIKMSYREQIEADFQNVDDEIAAYHARLENQSEKDLLEEVNQQWGRFVNQAFVIIQFSSGNWVEEATTASYEAVNTMNEMNEQLMLLNNLHNEELDGIGQRGDTLFKTVMLIIAIGTIVAVLISIGGIRYLLRTIQKPIVALSGNFKLMATGDLTIQPLLVKSNDEIGQLGTDFNALLNQYKLLMTKLHEHAETVATTSVELSSSAEETMRASTQITKSIIEVSEGATVQLESARSSNIIVEEITVGMDQAAASIQKVSELAIATTGFAKTGTTIMASTMQKMDDIEQSTETTAHLVESLHKKSIEIGKIVSIITKIAGQTKLLALNASIEAARAGEHGRGFAVVASEVSNLAAESNTSASDIRRLIEEIQQEVGQAISAMSTSKSFVAEGLSMVNESSDSFHEIYSMISDVSAQAADISSITEEINASTHTMKQLVDVVTNLSVQADTSSQDIVAAAEEQSATMQEISASSSVLSSMAETMRDLISIFKIK